MQINQNLGSSVGPSRPFYFLQSFKHCLLAFTFKHCGGFSCPNTFLFYRLLSLFTTEDRVWFKKSLSQKLWKSSWLLNCFWMPCGKFQAIKIFGKAPIIVSMITMFWFQFLGHSIEWIFHFIWLVGRFHRCPFADILKLFQFILRSSAPKKVYKWFTSWTLETNHTYQGFLLLLWNSSLYMLCLSRCHVFRLPRCTLSNYL